MINRTLAGLDSPQKRKHNGNHGRSFETPVERELLAKLEACMCFLCVRCFDTWSMEEKEAVRSPQLRS